MPTPPPHQGNTCRSSNPLTNAQESPWLLKFQTLAAEYLEFIKTTSPSRTLIDIFGCRTSQAPECAMPIPDLPEQPAEDSMLSLKFGKEILNYFSGSPLNRLSFLRTDHEFLQAAFSHSSAAFLALNNLNPLVKDASHLAFVSGQDIIPMTGPNPFEKKEDEVIRDFNSEETQPLILFLGVAEKSQVPADSSAEAPFQYKDYRGRPYFAVDVTPRGTLTDSANKVIAALQEKGLSFHDSSPRHMGLTAADGK